jgi:hypothetical protein
MKKTYRHVITAASVAILLCCGCAKQQPTLQTTVDSFLESSESGDVKTAGELPMEVDWKGVRNDMRAWHAGADLNAVWITGFSDQTFLISKSGIIVVDDGNTLRFAPNPEQETGGMCFLMPQNEWFVNLDEAVQSMKTTYVNRKCYNRKKIHLVSLEQLIPADR